MPGNWIDNTLCVGRKQRRVGAQLSPAGIPSGAARRGLFYMELPYPSIAPRLENLGKAGITTTHDRGMRGRHMTVFGFIFEPTEHSNVAKVGEYVPVHRGT